MKTNMKDMNQSKTTTIGTILIITSLSTISLPAFSAFKQIPAYNVLANVWECKSRDGRWSKILVTANTWSTSKDSRYYVGTIEVGGNDYDASYKLKGFNREWSFGKSNHVSGYGYIFSINLQGDASYHDLSGDKTAPSMYFTCRVK